MKRHEIAVLGSTMSYVEAGERGPTVLLLHGNPTSSFIWRNVIPQIAPSARCVAPDLIGFGRSGKPDIGYRFADHVRYVDAFIEALGLKQMYFVVQDWGSALGFHYAARKPDSVRGLAFMEFIRPMPTWEDFSPEPQAQALFKAFRTPGQGEKLVREENAFVEQVIPSVTVHKLSEEEMMAYRDPFPTPASRKPILAFPRDLPIAGEPADVYEMSEWDHEALRESQYPKLLFHGDPGALISPATARKFAGQLRNCQLVNLGPGRHYLQEDHGETIGRTVADWIGKIERGATKPA
jgi:haloalkane dehalogenase